MGGTPIDPPRVRAHPIGVPRFRIVYYA